MSVSLKHATVQLHTISFSICGYTIKYNAKLLRGQVKANDKSQSYTADAWTTILLGQSKNKETFLT